jgi:hypothetical protein
MVILFTATLQKFASQGEKTGWTYITVPKKIAGKIKPGIRKSFRVKGSIDAHPVKSLALIPMGEGDFIIAVNAEIRKAIKKQKGAQVELRLEEDAAEYKILPGLLTCLKDEPAAFAHFNSLLPSHQRYYSKWIEQAKTDATRTKRIAMAVNAMTRKISFAEMLKHKEM